MNDRAKCRAARTLRDALTNGRFSRQAGVTLTELMVAVVIMTVGVLGLMGSFQYVTRSIRISRLRTIANNLAQEKIESLKNLSYSTLLVTTNTYTNNNFNPPIVYDTVNYPPTTLTLWGGSPFTRAVYVAYATSIGGSISTVPYTSNDTGLKLITSHVFWNQDGAWRKITLTNLLENPNMAALDATISGTVTQSPGGGALPKARVQVVGSPQWQAYADSSGNYSFQIAHGSYTVSASSQGYRSQTSGSLSVPTNGSVTQNFTLVAIGSGTVSTYSVYVDSNLVVSQVVASTVTQVGNGTTQDVEYVELFNPTANPINVGPSGSPTTRLNYKAQGSPSPSDVTNFPLTYVSTYVPPLGYYLISNATSFYVLGGWANADAYYAAPLSLYQDVILKNKSGAIQITDSSGNILDGVGWTKNTADFIGDPTGGAPWYEGNPVPLPHGLRQGDQLVRMSSPCVVNTNYGRAYEPNDNSNSFFYNTAYPPPPYFFSYPPYNASTTKSVISGVPSVGGYAAANDGLSAAATLVSGSVSAPAPNTQVCPYVYFNLVGVATGTWTVQVATGIYSQTISGVSVTQGVTTVVLNGATGPTDPTGFNYVPISSTTSNGYVSGTVEDGTGAPISGIRVSGPGASAITGSNGLYFLSIATGTATVYANPSQQNPAYVSQSGLANVLTGQLATLNFTLSQGGVIQAYVTTGLSPLAGIIVTATNNTGGSQGSAVSDNTGNAYINDLATGTYSVAPTLDSSQSSSPTSFASVSLSGTSVFAGTFTITGAYATITGSVNMNSSPITSGVLVIASSATLPASGPPPAVYASSSSATAYYYAASSQADGTYSILVLGSTNYTYNMGAYYPTVDANSGATAYTSKFKTGLSVSPGGALSGQNFTWP